jgi:hypothetical protein
MPHPDWWVAGLGRRIARRNDEAIRK